jgi:Zn-dependent peptidase ImmA (M78 family)
MTKEDEEYADAFAFALIMPEKEVILRVKNGDSLSQLAASFKVEEVTMRTRLVRLGLWDDLAGTPCPPRRWSWLAKRFSQVT